MIDMKSFLVSREDYAAMQEIVHAAADVDVLGREGAMLHIFQRQGSPLSALDFHKAVQEGTDISLYTEFSYQQESILNYMLLLQDILAGFLTAFSAVLFLVCMVVTGHSLSTVVEQDKKDMAVLKTLGMPGGEIRNVYFLLYGGVILTGMLFGLLFAERIADMLARGLVTSTGMLVLVFSAAYGVYSGIRGFSGPADGKDTGGCSYGEHSGNGGEKKSADGNPPAVSGMGYCPAGIKV